MNTIEDFDNAPVGSTASTPNGRIAFKTGRLRFSWSIYNSHGEPVDNRCSDEMIGYALTPVAPKNSEEALDLAWNLAHEVKEGQVIPKGTQYLEVTGSGLKEYIARIDFEVSHHLVPKVRTHELLLDPEPNWLDAPAVLAAMDDCSWQKVWLPKSDGNWECTCCGVARHWSKMTDVTPLYPKEDTLHDAPRYRAFSFRYDRPWGTGLGGDPA